MLFDRIEFSTSINPGCVFIWGKMAVESLATKAEIFNAEFAECNDVAESCKVAGLPWTNRMQKFCLFLFDGGDATQAAIDAKYSKKTAASIACTLKNKPQVKARLNQLYGRVEKGSIMTVEERLERLSEISRAKLPDFIKLDNEGNMIIDLDTTNNAALAEAVIEDWQGFGKAARSRTKKIKLLNPISAIDLLNKMDKLYSDEQDNRQLTILNATFRFVMPDGTEKTAAEVAHGNGM